MHNILRNLVWAVLAVGGVVALVSAGMVGLGTALTIAFITPSWLLFLFIAFVLTRRYKKRLANKQD